ncbi:unnamed protein product [Adineta ricciae]|uniref:Uncharacterized protein n=1 Tax=Adineta ricciae TaxID=249248 RepID=A0A814WUZ5_ADIRI|nr:unnamed protein product [Adineta ricciae]
MGVFVSIISDGFSTDIKGISWVCKIQIYASSCCIMLSFTHVCLATIDQCLPMSKYRRFSIMRVAEYAIFIGSGYGIPLGNVFTLELIPSNPSYSC